MEIRLSKKQKIKLTSDKERQSVEIGKACVEAGILKLLTEPGLSIFLYLATHLNQEGKLKTNPTLIAGCVPYSADEVKSGLDLLQNKNIISIEKNRDPDYTFEISINFQKLTREHLAENKPKFRDTDTRNFREKIVRKQSVKKEELEFALLSFMVNENQRKQLQENVEDWLEDFELKMLQELIRRVDKWLSRNNHQSDKATYYLQGIVDDWYRKEIFSYERLQHFDRLFRESKKLAQSYGFKDWQNLSPVQMETFKSWISGENALSLELAQFAIKEAVKRKKDGQPSLKYIEDNFIKPWQKRGLKTITEAKKFLETSSSSDSSEKNDSKTKFEDLEHWESFEWDLDFNSH